MFPPRNGHTTIAIIGAGPIGLEAAIHGLAEGRDVHVFDKSSVGGNVRQWGFVQMFSPWKYNRSPLGVRLLEESYPGMKMLDDEACPTGDEFLKHYLVPLSSIPLLKKRIHTRVHVHNIGKDNLSRLELIGNSARTGRKFRLLVSDSKGRESVLYFDVVIDVSGNYSHHNWMGNGGIPAMGEQKLEDHVVYTIDDVLGRNRRRYAGKRTLLVGHGHSAATTLMHFLDLIREFPKTSLIWVSRSQEMQPYDLIENDPLPLRAELMRKANDVAASPPRGITYLKDTTVEAVNRSKGRLVVTMLTGGNPRKMTVDRIIANVGYGPDNSVYRELQVHECYASRAPYKLSAALLGSAAKDCLDDAGYGIEALKNPEPNFFIIGSKSYGKLSTFLIRAGIDQIRQVYSAIPRETLSMTNSPA